MIKYWREEGGRLSQIKKNDISLNERIWVDARMVTHEDIEVLKADYEIENDHILDILDPDELSRLENGENYVLLIMRLPVFESGSDVQYLTAPLGIIIRGKRIITICWSDLEVLRDFSMGRVRQLSLKDFPAMVIRFLSRADATFLRYLKEINRHSTAIQAELQLSIENKEILELLSLEKSLVYFTTSLQSNQLLIEKIRKTKLLYLDEDDIEWLIDVDIDNRQAIEMAETYRNVLIGIMDAFASVISNNLNVYMKKLAIINILMLLPTFITSFFGMNFPLPFARLGKWAVLLVCTLCVISVFVTNYFINLADSTNKNALSRRSFFQKRKEKKDERRLKKIKTKIKKIHD